MKLLLFPDVDLWNFVVEDLSCESGILLFPLQKNCNYFQLFSRKIFRNLVLPSSFLLGKKIRKALEDVSDKDSIIVADYIDFNLLSAISRCIKNRAQTHLWLWNPVAENNYFNRQYIKIKKLGFEIHTFNPEDSKQFSLTLNNQFYPMFRYENDEHSVEKVKYDFFFIGYPKGRTNIIKSIQSHLNNYKLFVKLVQNTSDYVPYHDYIDGIRESKCVIDIPQKDQSGLTLRVLEATAFRKKVLTTNKSIMKTVLYDPNNIFIVGIDSWSRLNDFIVSPYVKLNKDVIESFDVSCWLKNF